VCVLNSPRMGSDPPAQPHQLPEDASGLCDVCNRDLAKLPASACTTYSAAQFRKIVSRGYTPAVGARQTYGLGMPRDWRPFWVAAVREDGSDWKLCPACAAEARYYAPPPEQQEGTALPPQAVRAALAVFRCRDCRHPFLPDNPFYRKDGAAIADRVGKVTCAKCSKTIVDSRTRNMIGLCLFYAVIGWFVGAFAVWILGSILRASAGLLHIEPLTVNLFFSSHAQ